MIEIIRAGLLTTVQDRGRRGYRRYGVPLSGTLDFAASRLANALVGNDVNAAVLEATLDGPTLIPHETTIVAVCGAECAVDVEGLRVGMNRSIRLRAGERLSVGRVREGCRQYIAVAGGIDVPLVLGSRSTFLRGGFGGLEGRVLRGGDLLPTGRVSLRAGNRVDGAGGADAIDEPVIAHRPASHRAVTLPILAGPEFLSLHESSRRRMFVQEFVVSPESDRMGIRFRGEPLRFIRPISIASRATLPGFVQLPPDGEPILLLADCGTTGGYPVVAIVDPEYLSAAGQIAPGQVVRFSPADAVEV